MTYHANLSSSTQHTLHCFCQQTTAGQSQCCQCGALVQPIASPVALTDADRIALLRATLAEALDEYEYATKYKGDYFVQKHEDRETLARLRAVLASTGGGMT